MKNRIFNIHKKLDTDVSSELLKTKVLINNKNTVDINILLNRVKVRQLQEKKSKIIFCGIGLMFLSFFGFFISILK